MTMLYSGWCYLALKGQLNMARAVGAQGDLEGIERKMHRFEEHFNKTFWNGKEYRSQGYKGKTDDRVHALAVVSGLAKPGQYDAIRAVFRTQEHSSPYMEKYVGEALCQMDFAEDAIVRTKKRFKEMTDHPHTSLFERRRPRTSCSGGGREVPANGRRAGGA